MFRNIKKKLKSFRNSFHYLFSFISYRHIIILALFIIFILSFFQHFSNNTFIEFQKSIISNSSLSSTNPHGDKSNSKNHYTDLYNITQSFETQSIENQTKHIKISQLKDYHFENFLKSSHSLSSGNDLVSIYSLNKTKANLPFLKNKGFLLLKPVGEYGRTNNHIFMLRDFLLFAKKMDLITIIDQDIYSFMNLLDLDKLNEFTPIFLLHKEEISETCTQYQYISSICLPPTISQIKKVWDKIPNGQIPPYQYFPSQLNSVHIIHRRDHEREECAKYYKKNSEKKCFVFISGVKMFFSFDYSMDPSLFYKFHEHFKWKSSIYEKVNKFNSFFSKKFGVKSFHYLAIHLRLTDLSFEFPTDDEVLSTIESELKRMDHLPNLKLFIATDNHGDRRIIELKIRFASILLEDSNTNIHFSHTTEHLFFDMQMCINADHFIGLAFSTLTFNINMLRFFGPKKYPLNSSNFWPRYFPTVKGKSPNCCFPNLVSSSCYNEDFSCYPYLNTSLTPQYYLRSISETDSIPSQNYIFVKFHIKNEKQYNIIDFNHQFSALRFIFSVAKIWNYSIIVNSEIDNIFLSQYFLNRFVPYKVLGEGKSLKRYCDDRFNFSKIWEKCVSPDNAAFLFNIIKGFNDPFKYFPFQYLISSIIPSLKPAEQQCLDLYQKSPSKNCIVFDLNQYHYSFSFDWSYRPSLIFNFYKYYKTHIYDDLIRKYLPCYDHNILSVYISPSIYSQINNVYTYIDVIKHELKLLQVSPQHEYEYLFIFPLNMSSPLYLTIVGEFGDILVKHPDIYGPQLSIFCILLSSLSQRFLGDESIVSQNIFFMRTFGSGFQFPASNTSFWPNQCKKPECNQIPFESFPYKASHPQEYSKYPYYYTLPLTPIDYVKRVEPLYVRKKKKIPNVPKKRKKFKKISAGPFNNTSRNRKEKPVGRVVYGPKKRRKTRPKN